MRKICFLGFGTYPILAKWDKYDAGGSELQQVLLGKKLAKLEYDITFIDFDYGQNPVEKIDGIRIVKTFTPKDKAKISSYIPNILTIAKMMKAVDADVYYQRTGIYFIPLLFCKVFHKRYIYAIAHDRRVEKEYSKTETLKQILLNFDSRLNLKYANTIIAQTQYQRDKVFENYGKHAVLIKNSYILNKKTISKSENPSVLWVATMRVWKRPEIFIELAERFPNVNFTMIGGPSEDQDYYQSIISKSERLNNLNFMGFVPLHVIEKYFEKAWIFVNTSEKEGFPNTFLQAWANYTPVVSLSVDPDEIICKNKLGFHSNSFDQMVVDLGTLLDNPELRNEFGLNGKKYIKKEHDLQVNVEKLRRLM